MVPPPLQVYLRFTVFLAVHGTSQIFSKVVPVAPEPPQITVTAPARLALGAKSRGSVKFRNPLPVKMEKVVLTVEGDGLLEGEVVSPCSACCCDCCPPPPPPPPLSLSLSAEDVENVVGTIEAGAEFTFSFDLYGLLPGQHQLVAGLDSDKVEMVSGEAEVEVVEGLEETDAPPVPEEVQVVSVDLSLDVNRRVRGEG